MGVADPKAKAGIADPRHVCDLVNGGFFCGRQILDSAKMRKIPNTAVIVYGTESGGEMKKERTSDGMFQYDEQERFFVISLENQHDDSYIMPLRDMLITALLYDQQAAELRKEHKAKKELKSSTELLSGIMKEDRLSPVCCIVFYHGEEPWKGPTRLHELIEFPPGTEEMKKFCPDFEINLIDWNNVNPNHFKTGLRQLFELLPYAGSIKKLRSFMEENRERYNNISEECCDLVANFLGVKALEVIRRQEYRNDGGGYNMCRALEELERDARAEGKEAGIGDMLLLTSRMVEAGEADKIPLMLNDPALLQEMLIKYEVKAAAGRLAASAAYK